MARSRAESYFFKASWIALAVSEELAEATCATGLACTLTPTLLEPELLEPELLEPELLEPELLEPELLEPDLPEPELLEPEDEERLRPPLSSVLATVVRFSVMVVLILPSSCVLRTVFMVGVVVVVLRPPLSSVLTTVVVVGVVVVRRPPLSSVLTTVVVVGVVVVRRPPLSSVVTTAGVVVVEPDNELFEPMDELLLDELEEELDLLESKPEEELDLLESELEEELDLPESEPEEELDLLESEPEAVTLAAMTITPSKAVIRDWEERMVFMDTIGFGLTKAGMTGISQFRGGDGTRKTGMAGSEESKRVVIFCWIVVPLRSGHPQAPGPAPAAFAPSCGELFCCAHRVEACAARAPSPATITLSCLNSFSSSAPSFAPKSRRQPPGPLGGPGAGSAVQSVGSG